MMNKYSYAAVDYTAFKLLLTGGTDQAMMAMTNRMTHSTHHTAAMNRKRSNRDQHEAGGATARAPEATPFEAAFTSEC